MTRHWWDRREAFELFSSRLVVHECQAGDPQAAADRMNALAGIPLLDQGEAEEELAAALMQDVDLPDRARLDALHIAIAATNGMEYLLTWNCRHISNVTLRPGIEAVCRRLGYEPPLICSPFDLQPED